MSKNQIINEGDKFYINEAISLAKNGRGRVSPNPMVGCIVVKNNKIIGSGYHKYHGGPHAEVEALSKLSVADCKDSTLYITMEPCVHYGKTPPCASLVCRYPFKRIVVGSYDPNPLVRGRGVKFLKDKGYDVACGVEEDKLKELNEEFYKHITRKLPFVTLKAAISLDGKIAASTGDSKWITSEDSRKDAHRLRCFHDAVMVGISTVIADNPMLDCRMFNKEKLPVRIVVDPNGRIPFTSKIVNTAKKIKTIVVINSMLSAKEKDSMRKQNLEIIELDLENGHFDLNTLLKKIYEMKIGSILIEGGGKTLGIALEQGIADKVYLYMAPIIVGQDGKDVFSIGGIENIADSFKLNIVNHKKIGPDVRVTAYIEKKTAVNKNIQGRVKTQANKSLVKD